MADIHNRVATNIAKMEVREVEAHSRRWEPGSNSDLIRSQRLRMEKLCQA
jgi:hypothetical protein